MLRPPTTIAANQIVPHPNHPPQQPHPVPAARWPIDRDHQPPQLPLPPPLQPLPAVAARRRPAAAQHQTNPATIIQPRMWCGNRRHQQHPRRLRRHPRKRRRRPFVPRRTQLVVRMVRRPSQMAANRRRRPPMANRVHPQRANHDRPLLVMGKKHGHFRRPMLKRVSFRRPMSKRASFRRPI